MGKSRLLCLSMFEWSPNHFPVRTSAWHFVGHWTIWLRKCGAHYLKRCENSVCSNPCRMMFLCFQGMSWEFIHLFQNVMVHIMIMIVGVVKLASLKQSDCSGKTHCFFVLINLLCRITLKFTSPRTTNITEVTCLDMDCGWKHINALKFVETKEMIKGTGHDESQGLGWDVRMLWSWYRSDCWTVITKVWICGPWVYCFSAAMIQIQPRFGMWTFTWSLWIELDSNMQAHGVFLILSFLRWGPMCWLFWFLKFGPGA